MSIQFFGLPVSRGVAIGRAVLVASSRVDVAHYFIGSEHVEEEVARLRQARDTRVLPAAVVEGVKAPPTDSYKLADVQAAAAEAGISARYVALALAEKGDASTALATRASPPPVWQQRLARRLELVPEHGLSLTRTVDAPPATTLQELGRLWQGMP